MSSVRRVLKALWSFLDAISVPVAIVFLVIGFAVLHHQSNEIHGQARALAADEAHTHAEAVHTRAVQVAGEPVGRCLLDALKAVSPLLLRITAVEEPLATYVQLQSKRYTHAPCPTPKYLEAHR